MDNDIFSQEDYSKENPLRNHSSRVIPLWVDGKPPFRVGVFPTTLDYGLRLVDVATPLRFKIVNHGFQTLVIKSITITGNKFQLPTIIPTEVKANREVEVEVIYFSHEQGAASGHIDIEFENLDTERVLLSGDSILDFPGLASKMLTGLWEFIQRATLPAITTTGPVLSLSNTAVSYTDPVEVGNSSGITTITISNLGNKPLVIDNLAVVGDFEIMP